MHRKRYNVLYLDRNLCHQIVLILVLKGDRLRVDAFHHDLGIGKHVTTNRRGKLSAVPCQALFHVHEVFWLTAEYQYLRQTFR